VAFWGLPVPLLCPELKLEISGGIGRGVIVIYPEV
jgi:hypothetical protein